MDPKVFESHVLHVCRQLWSESGIAGPEMLEGRERDGVFDTGDVLHIVEATTSERKGKAESDANKIADLIVALRKKRPDRLFKGHVVTLREPTAEQRAAVDVVVKRKKGVSVDILSCTTLASKLVPAIEYLECRRSYLFGSARSLADNAPVDKSPYIRLPLHESETGQDVAIESVVERILASDQFSGTGSSTDTAPNFVFVGDYGAGKSRTLQHIFDALKDAFLEKRAARFPVYINLYDHHGQDDPSEAIVRHCNRIGFHAPEKLVRAWRAGYAVVILDGFDELATSGWAGRARRLTDLRRRAAALIRNWISESPNSTPIVVAGRAHFFDSPREMVSSLGLRPRKMVITVGDFREEDVPAFLSRFSVQGKLPDWLPRRPLLLGYLARHQLVGELDALGLQCPPSLGWDRLITEIADRESKIDQNIDGQMVRQILERLATRARRLPPDGLGPLTEEMMQATFEEVCGYQPDDSGMVLIQRLPGLAVSRQTDGAREFVDADFADALRAGDLVRFVDDPYNYELPDADSWSCPIGGTGLELLCRHLSEHGTKGANLRVAVEQIQGRCMCEQGAIEIAAALLRSGDFGPSGSIFVHGGHLDVLEVGLEDSDGTDIEFQESMFGELRLEAGAQTGSLPKFVRCYFEVVEAPAGFVSRSSERFVECIVDHEVETTRTTSGILDLAIPLPRKVLLTVLKKLFAQAGSGRMESALFRGLDQHAQALVPDVLKAIESERLASLRVTSGRRVWVPNRAQVARAKRLLVDPLGAKDSLFDMLAGG